LEGQPWKTSYIFSLSSGKAKEKIYLISLQSIIVGKFVA
jgi:hypothetical protein